MIFVLISQEWFVAIIIIAIIFPIISVIALMMVIEYEKEFRLLKRHAKLEQEFQESKYIQLNTQIQPHFLFNTINLILGYARIDEKEKLIKSIENFSIYLKYNYQIQNQLIPLYRELEYTKNYLEIQQSRFEKLLKIEYETDSKIEDTLVPPYILHTLVENAFQHGLEKKPGEKILRIISQQENEMILIRVLDNGVGIEEKSMEKKSSNYGLKNLKSRLILLFGESNISLTLTPLEEGGTEALVKFPLLLKKRGVNYEDFSR